MSTYEQEREAAKALYGQATSEEIIKVDEIFSHADQHYNENGWDLVAETWERYEVFAVLISVGGNVEAAKRELLRRVKPTADYRDEVQAEIF